MRYTEEYKALQQELHGRGGYGTSGFKHADRIIDLSTKMKTKDILDYGCGQNTLAKCLSFPITSYDPFIPGYDDEPRPHKLVVCSDVLEHIEPDCLGDVLQHIQSLTLHVLFLDVACRPAKKQLADGRNAHILLREPKWWLSRLGEFFDPQSYQTYEGGFVAVMTPPEAICDPSKSS